MGQSAGWGMLFSAVAADPMLGKHGRRGEGRRVEHWVPEWMFSLPVPTPFFFTFYEEFRFQARRSWPLCSNPAESRRGGGPVARNKRPHRLRRCRRVGAPVCWTAGGTGSSASSWPSCLGGLPGDRHPSTVPPPPPPGGGRAVPVQRS